MGKKGSLFGKYFTIYSLTLALCTLFLGAILIFLSYRQFGKRNTAALMTTAEKAQEITAENYYRNMRYVSVRALEKELSLIEAGMGPSVIFADTEGKIVACSEPDCNHRTMMLPKAFIEKVAESGSAFEVGELGGVFRDNGKYTYGTNFEVEGEIIGYILVSTPLAERADYLLSSIGTFAAALIITMICSSIIIFYSTKMLTKPIEEITDAAERFGHGDLDVRVSESGDDEIGHLATVFNRMAETFSELELSRRSFVANVSHELRTPMTSIGGYVDGILDGTISEKQQNEYLKVVSDEIKRLSRLTSSLLAITSMEAKKKDINFISVNSWDVILEILWSMEQRINAGGIVLKDLQIERMPVLCDPDLLHLIIYNLIDNAIKFTPRDGFISITVKRAAEYTRICVCNSSLGIPSEDIPHLFERFYKGDKSRSIDKSGTGLGLYIVKTLVTMMHGDISLTCDRNNIVKFTVSLKSRNLTDRRGNIDKRNNGRVNGKRP
ncbi:MAG: HAMP domain-containing histidine kinase [Ruminococcaceae bacterium]|nr:HAMP domain-containing histidine kinase [Oscillospiraceae bacterium]